MNFTPLNLFNFQPIGKDDRKRGKLELAIRSHRIDLSKKTTEAIGKPECVQIGTDGHFLAIWPEDGAFPVSYSRGSGASVNGSANIKRLQDRLEKLNSVDFTTQYVVLADPVTEDGKLIYDVENLTVCTKQIRRSA